MKVGKTGKMNQISVAILALLLFNWAGYSYGQPLKITQLRTELLTQPEFRVTNGYPDTVGLPVYINNSKPLLGWEISGPPNSWQSAYRVCVLQGKKLVWDSGKVLSDVSHGIIYDGPRLDSRQTYSWQVMIWDQHDKPSDWSEFTTFHTGAVSDRYQVAVYPQQKTDEIPQHSVSRGSEMQFDFGRASFGQLRIYLKNAEEGDTLGVRLGEAVDEEGKIDSKPGGTIRYAEYQIPLQKGTSEYVLQLKPDQRNTGVFAVKMPEYIGEVFPFRYVELTSPRMSSYTANVTRSSVHYPFDDRTSHFTSSDTILNAIWDLCKYSIKATSFAGIYVDGDRERIPYEADIRVTQLSHYYAEGGLSMARRSLEYVLRHATWFTDCVLQTVPIALVDFLHTGDLRFVRDNYSELFAKLLIPLREANGLISTRTGRQTPAFKESIFLLDKSLNDLVDWPHPSRAAPGETDGFVFTTYNAVVNAFHFKALRDMARLAGELGKTADVRYLDSLAAETKMAMLTYFWDPSTGLFRDGIGTDHTSLHTNMLALAFGLVPPEAQEAVLKFIESRGMACSPYGSLYLFEALYPQGNPEYGLKLLTSTDTRSWYNMIRVGSTMTMEAWDKRFKPNLDWNHAWGTVPASAIPAKLFGLEPLEPGWRKFRIRPQFGSLELAEIQIPTIRGSIRATYHRKEHQMTLTFRVPGNTAAQVVLPGNLGNPARVRLNSQVVSVEQTEDGFSLPLVGSGEYVLEVDFE